MKMRISLACQKCKKHFFHAHFTCVWDAICPLCAFPNRVVKFKVPGKFQAQCPGCKKTLQAPLSHFKKPMQCPFCKALFSTDTGQEPPADWTKSDEKSNLSLQQLLPQKNVEADKGKGGSNPWKPEMPVESYLVKEESPSPLPPIPPSPPVRNKRPNTKKTVSRVPKIEWGNFFEKIKNIFMFTFGLISIVFVIYNKIDSLIPKTPKPAPQQDTAKYIAMGIDKQNKEYFDRSKFKAEVYGPVFTPQQAKRIYNEIDAHAQSAPKEVEGHVKDLADFLMQKATDDHMKARAAFRWIVDRIEYDNEGLKRERTDTNFQLDTSPKNSMKGRKTTCAGYAKLFCVLCDAMGVETRYLSGYARTKKDAVPAIVKDDDKHAWNAVKIDGVWHLLDCTWADGNYTDKDGNRGEQFVEDFYFLTPPDQFIFGHFPDSDKNQFQLLASPYTWEDFRSWPYVDNDLFAFGITPKAVMEKIRKQNFDPPDVGSNRIGLKVIEAPLNKNLRAGLTQRFVFTCSPEYELFTSYKGPNPWVPLQWDSKNQHWFTSVELRRGAFEIVYRKSGAKKGEIGKVILNYVVN